MEKQKSIQVPRKLHQALAKDTFKYAGAHDLKMSDVIAFHRKRSLAFERMIEQGEIHIEGKP